MAAAAALVALASAQTAWAEPRYYSLAIGNNQLPTRDVSDDTVPLRFADDDAAAFTRFLAPLKAQQALLTVLDVDSQMRFPNLVSLSQPPSLVELERAVQRFRTLMEADLKAGHKPVLFLFFSGHGMRATSQRSAALALSDGELTQNRLYEIVSVLPAKLVHLLFDACYAEEVVRPRDVEAQTVELTKAELAAFLEASTLARFPHVGTIIAASESGQTHEWDHYRQGVFTHQLISGLRGAADVNGDSVVEYSELTAFMSAANREVSDVRGRLHVISRPPSSDRRAPVIDLSKMAAAARLSGSFSEATHFYVEDLVGNRILEMRAEPNYQFQVYLPANEPLYFVSAGRMAEFRGKPETPLRTRELVLRKPDIRTRSALTTAMRQGLFAESFGPRYYRGFVDSSGHLAPVTFSTPSAPPPVDDPEINDQLLHTPTKIALVTTGALVLTTAIFGVMAADARNDFDRTSMEREATEARGRFNRYRTLSIAAGVGAAVAAGTAGWMVWKDRRSAGAALAWRLAPVPSGLEVAVSW